jgi:hypothetical protein
MYQAKESAYIEPEDQCYQCHHSASRSGCPLLTGLALGVVTIPEPFLLSRCQWYTPRLRLVNDSAAPEPDVPG